MLRYTVVEIITITFFLETYKNIDVKYLSSSA
jgi:hypothetical protein